MEMPRKHLTEVDIDFLVFHPEELSAREKQDWTLHIDRCSLCRQYYDLALQFREDVYERLAKGAGRDDAAIAERVAGNAWPLQLTFGKLSPPERLFVVPVEQKSGLRGGLRRVIDSTTRYPFRTAGGVGLFGAMLLFTANLLTMGSPANPHVAKIQEGILKVFDAEGDLLWSRPARGMPEGSTEADFIGPMGSVGPDKPVVLADVSSEDGTELLLFWSALIGPENPSFSPESLYCFSARGDLLWAQSYRSPGFERFVRQKRGSWRINKALPIMTDSGPRPRLFVGLFNTPFSPGALLEVDGESGKPLQQYAHFGYLSARPFKDLSGKTRILVYGTNNAYSKPFLALLDPNSISGFGPTPGKPEEYGYSEGRRGNELAYLLFPRSFLGEQFAVHRQSDIEEIFLSGDGSIVAVVREFPPLPGNMSDLGGHVLFSFDFQLHVISVTFSDPLIQTHRRLVRQGHRLPPLDNAYAERLKQSVQYWDGEKFVARPPREGGP